MRVQLKLLCVSRLTVFELSTAIVLDADKVCINDWLITLANHLTRSKTAVIESRKVICQGLVALQVSWLRWGSSRFCGACANGPIVEVHSDEGLLWNSLLVVVLLLKQFGKSHALYVLRILTLRHAKSVATKIYCPLALSGPFLAGLLSLRPSSCDNGVVLVCDCRN